MMSFDDNPIFVCRLLGVGWIMRIGGSAELGGRGWGVGEGLEKGSDCL